MKWSDIWNNPRNFLLLICALLVFWGIFHQDQVEQFFEKLFSILLNSVLKVVIVIAIIVWILKGITSKK